MTLPADHHPIKALILKRPKKKEPEPEEIPFETSRHVRVPNNNGPRFSEWAKQDPAAVYLGGLKSPESRRCQASRLRKLATLLGATDWPEVNWAGMSYIDIQDLFQRLARMESSRSLYNSCVAALRKVMTEAFHMGLIDEAQLIRVKALRYDTQSGKPELAGRWVSGLERSDLIRAISTDTLLGLRDRAIMLTLFYAGLRRSEAAALKLKDIQLGEKISVRNGKGRKPRPVPMSKHVYEGLRDWQDAYNQNWKDQLKVAPGKDAPLFPRIGRWGKMTLEHISAQAIYDVFRRCMRQAGLTDMAPHDARRTFISLMLDASKDISATREIVGHKDASTTARYDRRGERAATTAVAEMDRYISTE